MKLVDLDAVEAQALEAAFESFSQVLGAGIMDPLPGTYALPPSLGGDDQAGGIRVESFGDQFFRDVWAVRVGGVDQVDAEFNRTPQGCQARRLVSRRSPDAGAGDAHGSIAHTIDKAAC